MAGGGQHQYDGEVAARVLSVVTRTGGYLAFVQAGQAMGDQLDRHAGLDAGPSELSV